MRLLVILGHEHDSNGKLSEDAEARCERAAELAHSYTEDYLILPTGGFGDYFNQGDSPHGRLVRDCLVSQGFDLSNFLPATASAGTVEDAWHTLRYVRQNRFTGNMDVVSSDFHMSRVRFIFSRTFPDLDISYYSANSKRDDTDLQKKERYEERRLREISRDWVDVARFDLDHFPESAIANLGDEVRHYDNLSLACVTAIVVAFTFSVTGSLPTFGLEIPNVSFLICAGLVGILYYLYLRFSATAGSARRVLKATEALYGSPGISFTRSHVRLLGFVVKTKGAISLLVAGLIAFLVLLAFLPQKDVEQGDADQSAIVPESKAGG
jgi:hypothetical protein